MKRINAIVKREFLSYFKSPIGYIVLALFMILTSFLYVTDLQYQYADVGTMMLSVQSILFMIVIPMLTMRSFSEERKNGSEILLLTSPASVFEIVIGKYLASLYVLFVMTATSVIYIIFTISFGGVIDAKVLGAYIGFLCIGAAYLAIGIFASSLTENQVIAAIITFATILVLMIIEGVASIMGSVVSTFVSKINIFGLTDLQIDGISKAVTTFFKWPNPSVRLNNFSRGIFEITPILFFVSLIAIFLFLTTRVIEKRRWTQK
ncbi:MAG: ABC transporter permease [Saccharofermentanales bacterium]